MRRQLVTSLIAAAALLPQAAFSAEEPATDVEEEETAEKRVFGVLDVDLLALGGFGSRFLYPHVEPALEVGILPLGKEMAISVGGGVDFGWCLLCGVLDVVSKEVDISGSYWGPRIRGNLHLGTLFGILDDELGKYTLDPYVGLWGGPTFYTFELTIDGDSFETTEATASIGPALGVRLGTLKNTLLLAIEYRWGAEAGFTTVNVEDDSGTIHSATDEVSRKGNDLILGIGLRI